MVFGDKNSNLYCDDKKNKNKKIFNDRKNGSVFIVKKKNENDFFKKRVSLTI